MTIKLDHEEMRLAFNDASSDTEMRDACERDMLRFWLDGQWWAGSYGKQFKNRPKPEFNKIFKGIMRITGSINDMELNSEIVANSTEADEEGAELLQKKWRNDYTMSDGAEASEIATMEAVVGGFGCTKQTVKYVNPENPNSKEQYICIEPIRSAYSSVFFEAGAVRKDKSDADRGWHLIRTNRKKVEAKYGVNVVSFMTGNSTTQNQSTRLDYQTERDIYLAHYWERQNITLTIYDFSAMTPLRITHTPGEGYFDDFGEKYSKTDVDEMIELYAEMTDGEKPPKEKREIKVVYYALADGEKWIEGPMKTPFKRIPLYPRYGYHAELNGQEYYCGEVRKKTDIEMFHNMFGSQMMQLASASQKAKPEYTPDQIARYKDQRARAEIEDVPYLVSDIDRSNPNSPIAGPIGFHQPPQIGTGLAAAGQFLGQQLAEENGIGQATTPANTSAQAINAVNERTDDTYLPMVRSIMHAIKAECEGYIPAAQTIYFSNPSKIRVMGRDGKSEFVATMEMMQLPSGEYGPYGNNPRGLYTVNVKQGEAYKDNIEATIEQNLTLMQSVGSDTVAGQILAYQNMKLLNKLNDPIIDMISMAGQLELIASKGLPYEPQSEEEAKIMQMIQQRMSQQAQGAQAQQQAMLQAQLSAVEGEAQARVMEGQAALMNEQNDAVKNQVAVYKAQTERFKAVNEAEQNNVRMNFDVMRQVSGLFQ